MEAYFYQIRNRNHALVNHNYDEKSYLWRKWLKLFEEIKIWDTNYETVSIMRYINSKYLH